jgi:SRSO17 transposase
MFDEAMARVAGRFGRVEPRRAAREFVLGLLSSVERKNCWWLAEQAGHATPDAMQRLLSNAVWDADAVRDDVRSYVLAHLGHPDGVLIADETGFLKKGRTSVGVQRQYSGTAGRIENSQVGVFLSYASPLGRALIDRRIYLPRSWTDDAARCAGAGIPDEVAFATKPALALAMIRAALDAGMSASWVSCDEVYGNDPAFRAGLEDRQLSYVLAVACDHRVPIDGGRVRLRADEVAAGLTEACWQRRSAGPGSKGPRLYDWAWVDLATPAAAGHSLLIRRASDGELAYYRCWSPVPVTLATLVRVAGTRWCVEEGFQAGKGQVGLDHYQCRGWTAWHRFTILAMLALAFLAAVAAGSAPPGPPTDPNRWAYDDGPIALTCNEIRHLIANLVITPARARGHIQACSWWRRRHQGRARHAHYRRRTTIEFGP